MTELEKLRERIDDIDQALLNLFAQRMEVTQKVGEYKLAHSMAVLDEEREKEVLAGKTALAPEALKGDVTALFETVMALSRRQQRRLVKVNGPSYEAYLAQKAQAAHSPAADPKVVYQGEPGAYAEEAAVSYLGEAVSRRNSPPGRTCLPPFSRERRTTAWSPSKTAPPAPSTRSTICWPTLGPLS